MASPQIENGHIDIANTIADKLCSYRLSGQEWQVVWVILRKTWGWLLDPNQKNGSKKKMDRIALSQFEALTGIDRRKCHSLLNKLVGKMVVKKTVTQKGDRIVITYGFQKNFDLWKVSPKKVTVTQKGDGVSPKKATKVSPNWGLTKEKKETITKDKELYTSNFLSFWNSYPRKIGKGKAFESYQKIKQPRPSLKIILDAIEIQNKTDQWKNTSFIPHPATWLNARRWEDELTPINNTDKIKTITDREQEDKELFANR
jgi:phage replication O-like protein O